MDIKVNGNGRTTEDDWVQVIAGDDDAKGLLPMLQSGKQDLYEATAEINDAEPCTSITVRLLSRQDKRCALVDEVYVFADPVDPSESEQEEASGAGNSSSSSLMAMFMPAILQLSRGKNVSKERDTQVSSDKSYSTTNPGSLGYSNDSDKIVNEIHQETNFSKGDQMGVSPPPVLVDTLSKRVSREEIRPAISCSNMETILYDLVNKVSRIETILTRFEDQMLKPINSIDARLQLVEKKLEQLGKNSFESELVCQTRIPNLDALGSDTDKIPDTDELDGLTKSTDYPKLVSCTTIVVPESSVEDDAVVLPKNRLEELESENSSNSNSGNEMVFTEPEISNEEVGPSFEEKPKRSLSVNDALASALAGLLSSHSITDGKYSKALVVTAPEFLNEDDEEEIEEKPQTNGHPDKSQVAAELGNTHSTLGSPTSSQEEPEITPCIKDGAQELVYDDSFGGDEEAETVVSIRDNALDEEMFTSSTNLSDKPRDSDSLIHELKNPNVTTAKCRGEPGMDDVLKSVFGLQPTTSSVDFLTPVLDVRFISESQDSDSRGFFEALFT
ncbi:PREDICTED: uncharacterized protein LOC104763211 [Camelina sativa]|uniref:Uncharacterized protein LOC104763211 n=1 Tax=Camelina sativa TaxID=90675 RepID=A0ABM1RAS7_CAMSA|nr:PREDICTED: uncharacterized protein LOC104763211 [Camelina sativa]